MGLLNCNRIIVVGNNGSGKSFLSKELSAITGLPLIHLDVEFWKPGWVMTPADEWIRKQTDFTAGEKWIIDGNHCSTMELRFKAADMVIFLDFNRFVCLLGTLRRLGNKREDMPQYLDERLDMEFFRFCRRLWNFPKTGRIIIMNLHEKYPEKPFIVIKSRSKLKEMLVHWENECKMEIL